MADNVTYGSGNNSTPATGTIVATDQVGSNHYQLVKLVDGTADSSTVVPAVGGGLNVQGHIAHDAADSGNPVKVGGKAKAIDGTDPGEVAENDRADFYTDPNGRQLVSQVHPNFFNSNTNYAAAQTNTALVAAPATNSLYVTDLVVSADGAGSVKLVEDTAGTPVTKAGPYYLAANTGLSMHFITPIKLTAAKNLGVTSTGAVNHTVTVTGYEAP